MALRARFFLEIWKAFLQSAGYPDHRHFISREAYDISMYLIDGLIALILVHRDHLPGEQIYLLCPWLHSTEPCEHSFGEGREQVPDFTFVEYIFMVDKIMVLLKAALLSHNSEKHDADARGRAQGYHHTYVDSRDVNLFTLSNYPSDDLIEAAARDAYEQAEGLFALCSVPPTLFDTTLPRQHVHLPGIGSFGEAPKDENDEDMDGSSLYAVDLDEADEISEVQQLQDLIDNEDKPTWDPTRKASIDDKMTGYACAAVLATVEDTARM
jgi:hypothetical protein